MGQPQSNNTAVFAVILVALILFLLIGGAVVVLGGLLFFASSDVQMQQVTASADYATMPAEVVSVSPATSSTIQLDDAGEITVNGQGYSTEELRTHLEEQVELHSPAELIPQLQADANCPEDVREEVIAICEEVTGNTPQLVVSAVYEEPPSTVPAPLPQDATNDNAQPDEGE